MGSVGYSVMAVVSARPPARRTEPCYICHRWMFDHLTYEHCLGRRTAQDEFCFNLSLQVTRDRSHVNTCKQRFCESFRIFRPVPVTIEEVFLTATEVDLMRKAGGAGLYAGAPSTTCDANTHFATYRLDKKGRAGDPVSIAALDQLFGYLTAAIMGGRNSDVRCLCFATSGIGMQSLTPVRFPHPREAQAESPGDDNPPEGPQLEAEPPVVDVHTTTCKLPGCELKFDSNEKPDTPPLAVRFLPEIEERLFWLNSQTNVEAAIKGRIKDPHVPMSMTDTEIESLKAVANSLRDELRSDETLLDKIIQEKIGVKGWASKKWSHVRAQRELSRLFMEFAPNYTFDAAIKLEPSKRGKPPRLLIADGDKGQVMAWVIVGTLEAWLFKRHRLRSIKGLPKAEAMKRVVSELEHRSDPVMVHPGLIEGLKLLAAIIENDGSAWDACMSIMLREIVENPIMEDVAAMVEKYIIPEAPPDFVAARLDANKLKTLKITLRKDKGSSEASKALGCDIPRGKSWHTVIDAIRRSGCRGTSVLNFLANLTCWCWVIGGVNATKLIKQNGQKVLCVDGRWRFVKMAYEGDDSVLSFRCPSAPDMNMTDEFLASMSARWTKLGHRPKLFWRKPGGVAEFTGWHFAVTEHGLDGKKCAPDLLRNLTNMAFTTNKVAIAAALDGNKEQFMRAVAPAVIAKCYPMARVYPQMARLLYRDFGSYVDSNAELSLDDLHRLDLNTEDFHFGEASADQDVDAEIERSTLRVGSIVERFRQELAQGDPESEKFRAVELGVCPTTDAYVDLLSTIEGGFKVGADNTGFADLIYKSCLPTVAPPATSPATVPAANGTAASQAASSTTPPSTDVSAVPAVTAAPAASSGGAPGLTRPGRNQRAKAQAKRQAAAARATPGASAS